MGSPSTGLPALVERRIENRVPGVYACTDRRSLETMGPNATGSHQTDRGDVTQRPKNGREKKYSRGLDNSGNIEGTLKGIFAPPRCERALWSRPAPPAGGHASPRAILCRPARRGLPRPACCGSETAPGQPATPACNHMPGVVYAFYAPLPQADRGLRQPHALS
jgi:hypothetical protein